MTIAGSALGGLVVEPDVDDLAAAHAVDARLAPPMTMLRRVRRDVVAHLDDERVGRGVDAEDVGAVDDTALLPPLAGGDERLAPAGDGLAVFLLRHFRRVQLGDRIAIPSGRAQLREAIGDLTRGHDAHSGWRA